MIGQPLETEFSAKLLGYINMLRQKPTEFIKYLSERELEYEGNSYVYRKKAVRIKTKEDVGAVAEAIAFLEKSRPVLPLEKDKKLFGTAKAHGVYLAGGGVVSHRGEDDREPEQRVVPVVGKGSLAECIVIGESKAKHVAINLLVDDGLEDRPNRKLITSKDFGQIGIFSADHPAKGHVVVIHLWGSPVAKFNYKFPHNELNEEPW